MIRLDKCQAAGRNLQQWCRNTLAPALLLVRLASPTNPRDWCLFVLGYWFIKETLQGWWMQMHHVQRSKGSREDGSSTQTATTHHIDNSRRTIPTRQSNKSTPPACTTTMHTDRDILTDSSILPCALYSHICTYLNPGDVAILARVSKASRKQADSNEVWKQFWYQDYGDTLLQWDVARDVLCDSLGVTAEECGTELKLALSQKFQQLDAKEFYFTFGEVLVNYLLAGYNTPDICLVGLHGHIFDFGEFAPYHPGLVDSIVTECGQDATEAFESIRHSRAARRLASMVCILVDDRFVTNSGRRGLRLRPPDPNRDAIFRQSNTRPPRGEINVAANLLPRLAKPRPGTLVGIRNRLEEELLEKRRSVASSEWRLYYDPFRREWRKWNSATIKPVASREDHVAVV